MIVFDVTALTSFKAVPFWILQVRDKCRLNTPIILVGNKSDLVDQREISTHDAQAFANESNLLYAETSAKGDLNVQNAFQKIVDRLYEL